MTPQESINVLSLATEPGVKLSRVDYVRCQQALEALNAMVEAQEKAMQPKVEPPATP